VAGEVRARFWSASNTNQGISGYGELYDGRRPAYALMLKSRILGENPCNVEKIFRKIKQFGGQSRQGGGVTAVEQACWDIAAIAYGVPLHQMLGGRYRNKVRLYSETPERSADPAVIGKNLKKRARWDSPCSRPTFEQAKGEQVRWNRNSIISAIRRLSGLESAVPPTRFPTQHANHRQLGRHHTPGSGRRAD
jgi:L-alanine-DL-glutamate epimerase-like enolase superfamily enzyme